MLIDAHTHLNSEQLFPEWRIHMQNFQNSGGKILVNSGANSEYNDKALLIANESKTLFPELKVKATLGIHPGDIKDSQVSDFWLLLQRIEKQYLEHKDEVIAIGECGIDLHFPDNASLSTQQEIFRLQAELARKLHLPIVIHSRDGFKETMEILKDFSDLNIYFHSRGYGKEEIRLIEQTFPNLWIGFNNIISYPSAHTTRESFIAIKNSKILMETDAPYLPPQSFRGKTNYPAYVSYVYDYCSNMLEIDTALFNKEISDNFLSLFAY